MPKYLLGLVISFVQVMYIRLMTLDERVIYCITDQSNRLNMTSQKLQLRYYIS
jgi:hypothetical protein